MEQVLYSLPDGWAWLNFDSLVENLDGKRIPIKTSERSKDKAIYPYYGATGIIDYVDDYIYEGEKLLISEDGANLVARKYPIAFLADGKYWVNNHAHVVDAYKDKISNKYLSYFFAVLDLSAFITGTAQPKLSQKKLNSIKIAVAPIAEQKRIVEKLDALLTRIDTAIEHLQESVTLADVLSKNGLSEIFERLKNSYEVVPLSSVVKINSGIALPKLFKNGFSDGDIPFFKVAQMNNHHETMVEPEITFNETVAKEHKIKLFPKGSTLIPKRGGAILTNKKRMLLEDASYDSNIMGLKADESKISDDYLFAFMRTIDLANFVDASTIPQVNNKHIDQMQIPLASIEEQADVVSRVNLLVKKVETMNSEIQRQLDDLQALKSSILDSAFKGEL
ncbi:restriction endonuclease subunit S [Aeromonas sp. QDB01]|uniref:restriction endonuclease subunit S n=1 Tax=Aeromonas TaxID=642 RepID=UPI0022E75AE8|nr:restriction endonuclease subunit S [Aeromonas sp. QDB01]